MINSRKAQFIEHSSVDIFHLVDGRKESESQTMSIEESNSLQI